MMAQMQAAQTAPRSGDSADGTVQVGINLEKMMENQKATALENMEVFGGKRETLPPCTREGDLSHRKHMSSPEKKSKRSIGLTLMHDSGMG